MKINHILATDILETLGYDLEDLSLKYGDVVIPGGDISHQLLYQHKNGSTEVIGYVYIENGIYYTGKHNNYVTAQQAALDLIDSKTVQNIAFALELERNSRTLEYA